MFREDVHRLLPSRKSCAARGGGRFPLAPSRPWRSPRRSSCSRNWARLDDRVEAHLDGLRIAGQEGWDIAREALGPGDAGEVFTLAVLAFEQGERRPGFRTSLTVGTASPELERVIVSAVGWIATSEPRRISGRCSRLNRPFSAGSGWRRRRSTARTRGRPSSRPRSLRMIRC